MVDFGGVYVKELTQDTKDGLLDPNELRSLPASATNPLITASDQPSRNFIINPGFRYAQRQDPTALTAYVSNKNRVYGADRWSMMVDTGHSISYKRIDSATPPTGLSSRNYGKFKKPTAASKVIVCQVVEGDEIAPLVGQVVRFQVRMKFSVAASMKVRLGLLYLTSAGTVDDGVATSIASALGAAATDPTWATNLVALAPTLPDGGAVNGLGMDCILTSGWVRYSACFTVPSDCKNVVPIIWSDDQLAANDELDIAEAGLHLGRGIPAWAPRSNSEELGLCQRFFFKTFDPDVLPANAIIGGAFYWAAGKAGALTENSPTYVLPHALRTTCSGFGFQTYNPVDGAGGGTVRDVTASVNCGALSQIVGHNGIQINTTGNASTAVGNLLAVHFSISAEI